MADPEHEDGVTLDLGDEEEWVLHAALLDHLDQRADDHEPDAVELLERLENGELLVLGRDQLELIRKILSEYLAGAPLRDRATCRNVLSEVREKL
ncbi:MAG: hypothetical protein ABEH90_01595 [Halolamina sp.]